MRELLTGRRGPVAAGLVIFEFISATQALVVATVMPRVVADLHGLGLYWLAFGAYLAASFVFLPFAGPWADRYGTRRIMAIALTLVATGLIFAALARTMPEFIAARTLEGVGAGLDYAASFTAIVKTFSERERPAMFALVSTTWIVPGLISPTLGALIATAFGWRWVFIGFLPLLALTAILVLPSIDSARSELPVDPFGSLRLLFSRATLRFRGRNAAFGAFATLHAAFFGADAYVTLMLTSVRGLSLTVAGACVTCGALGWSGASSAQPKLLKRFGSQRLVLAGSALGLLATSGMLGVTNGAPAWIAFAAWTLGGAGVGIAYSTLSLVGVANSNEGGEGAITSAMLLAGMLGMVLGVTICGLPITVAERVHAPLATAVTWTFALAMGLSLALAAAALRVPREVTD